MFNKPGIKITKNLLFGSESGKSNSSLPPITRVSTTSATEKAAESIVVPPPFSPPPPSPLDTPPQTKKRGRPRKKPISDIVQESGCREKTVEISQVESSAVVEWVYDGMHIPWIQ